MDPTQAIAARKAAKQQPALTEQAFYETHATDPMRPVRRLLATLRRAVRRAAPKTLRAPGIAAIHPAE
jgi:hypothetical protein